MLRTSTSPRNPDVVEWPQYAGEDNARFFTDAIADLTGERGDGAGLVALVGSTDLPGVALRRAQSVLRWDRRPSLWSHAFLLTGADTLHEVTLHSRAGHFPEPAYNAITPGTLDLYARDANVALLSVTMDEAQRTAVVDRATHHHNLERLRFDLFETLGQWYAYLWTRGTPNPLEQGVPMHSSAMVEYCFEAIALDLTPGASERNSAPEHLWNGACWWTDAFGEFGHGIAGRYVIRDPHCAVDDPEKR
jgi:hypothetical protein